MTTAYRVLTEDGVWIKIRYKKPIRNIKQASQIIQKKVIACHLGSFLDQFNFFIKKY